MVGVEVAKLMNLAILTSLKLDLLKSCWYRFQLSVAPVFGLRSQVAGAPQSLGLQGLMAVVLSLQIALAVATHIWQ